MAGLRRSNECYNNEAMSVHSLKLPINGHEILNTTRQFGFQTAATR